MNLEILLFPERESTKMPMIATYHVAPATMDAKIEFREGQTRVEVSYSKLKPAVLFAGDVTCYVLWAISRDGSAENLGELWARPEKDEDQILFSTGLKSFALLVTAESYYQVEKPSSFVIFQSGQRERRPLRATPLTFSSFAPAPRAGLDRLVNVAYDGNTPLDLIQAQRVYEIAKGMGAEEHADSVFRDATLALQQATLMSNRNARKGAQEYARRSVAASNDAIRITQRTLAALELEERIRQRQTEMTELEQKAAESEARSRQVQAEAEAAIQSLEQEKSNLEKQKREADSALQAARSELQRIDQERRNLRSSLQDLQERETTLKSSLGELETQIGDLRRERSLLENRLQGALSEIAETRESAQGFIVNLPDILFDLNEATLKPQAQLVLAKMTGVLLIMSDLTLKIEGHTDSTGSADYNLQLSQRRAKSVLDFLAVNGISSARMAAVGYGMEQPIADNATAEGRRQNRRVEIIISDGSR